MEVYRIDDDNLHRIAETELTREKTLENYLIRADGAVIGGIEILYIDQQGSPGEGGIFDIIGLDSNGDIVIIELKRNRTPRDIVAQALEYASSIRNEQYEELDDRYRSFIDDEGASLRTKHSEFFARTDDPLSKREFNTDQRLILVGREFSDLSLEMADFLREHGIDVVCVTYSAFASDDDELRLLTTENVRRPLSEEPETVSGSESRPRECTVDLRKDGEVIKTFEKANQSDAMQAAVEFLIDDYQLLERISLPYLPGRGDGDRALLNDTPTHPNGNEMMAYRELKTGHYLLTKLGASAKRRYLDELARQCGLEAHLSR
ncbi:hypothetical protein [Haladaptatus sp. DFWS20]|uniref:hypothetical protein n=1 Tax=Haladaptatus sp. DFWS20 TaxID=3403467 RepID=UPI003EB7B31E